MDSNQQTDGNLQNVATGEKFFRVDKEKLYRIHCGSPNPSLRRRIRLWFNHFGFHCVSVYRFGQFSRRVARRNLLLGLPFLVLHRFLNYLMRLIHHVEIDDADVGPGFYIGHVGTIYIGPTKIGSNFSVAHNVTIGVGHSGGVKGLPTIGDDVWVGTGSVIAGKISVGNGVTISNGCMLSRSVPDRSLVAGNPGRVILADHDNSMLL